MRFKVYITENKNYNNWVRYTKQSIRSDFEEYKKKEERKWRSRADMIGMRFPLFETFNDFKQALDNARIVNLTPQMDHRIGHRSHTGSLESLKNLVSGYIRPRDVDRIVDGFINNAKMPMPIVLEGNTGTWIMAGNTRLDTAFILGVKPKVIWIQMGEI